MQNATTFPVKLFSIVKLFLVIVLPIVTTACGNQTNTEKSPKNSQKTFIIHNGSEPEQLDPTLVTAVGGIRIVNALFEGLTELHPKTLVPQPGCSTWTLNNDQTVYTFKLKQNAAWSDGKSLTAHDFLYSWKRALTPATGASYANLLFEVKGAKDFYKGKISDFSLVGLKVIDPTTFQVTLNRPCGYFLQLCAFPTLYPVPRHAIEKHENNWLKSENLVCNGPFTMKSWQIRQKIELVRNPKYHDQKQVKLDGITFLPFEDLETSYQLFKQGKIHWMPSIPLAKVSEIKFNPSYYFSPYLGTYFYRFNVTRPPFDNPLVRRAFSMAVDRETITGQILAGGERPTSSFCPEMDGYKPVKGLSFDPAAAKNLLKKAGYGPKNPFPKVELSFNTRENDKIIAEAIVQQWKENLGIQVTLTNNEWKVYLANQKALKYQISRSSWVGDYGHPSTFFDIFTSTSPNNRTGWKNKKFDELNQKARETMPYAERNPLYQQAEKLLVEEDCVIIPIYYYVNKGLISEDVTGWHDNILDWHTPKYLNFKR